MGSVVVDIGLTSNNKSALIDIYEVQVCGLILICFTVIGLKNNT